jgi:hypothetical protein
VFTTDTQLSPPRIALDSYLSRPEQPFFWGVLLAAIPVRSSGCTDTVNESVARHGSHPSRYTATFTVLAVRIYKCLIPLSTELAGVHRFREKDGNGER